MSRFKQLTNGAYIEVTVIMYFNSFYVNYVELLFLFVQMCLNNLLQE